MGNFLLKLQLQQSIPEIYCSSCLIPLLEGPKEEIYQTI